MVYSVLSYLIYYLTVSTLCDLIMEEWKKTKVQYVVGTKTVTAPTNFIFT